MSSKEAPLCSLNPPILVEALSMRAILSNEHVDEDIDLQSADSTRFLGGDKTCCFCYCFSVRLSSNDGWLRLEGSGIPCGRGEEGSVWKRDSRWVSWRGGRVGAVGSGVGGLEWKGVMVWDWRA
ncbi:hypothetical protein FCV25MIE_10200 [Fagus crenata]